MNDVSISVLIPLRNNETLITRCVESIIKQDYDQSLIEIHILENASTDNSWKVINELKQKYSNIFVHQTGDISMLQVRKQLVSFANNEYIFWADADDYLSEDAFKNLVKTSDNQKPDLIIGKTKFHFFNSLMFQKLTANMFSKRTKTKERWMVQNGVFLWSKLFKTSILKKSTIENIDDKKLYYAVDDLFLFFFLRKVQTIKFCTKIVYHYIDVPTSQSHTKNRLWETTELFEGLSYFISKLPKNKTQFDILQMNEFNANILFILFFRWKRIDKEQREKISIMIKSFVDKHNLKWPKPKFWLHKLGLFLSTKRKIKRVYKHKK